MYIRNDGYLYHLNKIEFPAGYHNMPILFFNLTKSHNFLYHLSAAKDSPAPSMWYYSHRMVPSGGASI